MPDRDSIVLRDLGDTVTMVDVKYRLASPADRLEMKPQRDEALSAYPVARDRLLEEGIICTDEHILEMRMIRAEIEAAAEAQATITGLIRLAGFLRGL